MLSTVERTEEKETKMDPRARRTRQLLLDSLMDLLREKSFEEITVQDIAARATVNRATFYAHFPDKYALGDTLMQNEFTQILQKRLPTGPATPQDYVRSLLLAVTDHWMALHGKCRKSYRVFESLVESLVKGILFNHVHAWIQERNSGSRQDREMIATIVSASIYSAAMQWTQVHRKESAEDFVGKAVPVITASLLALESGQ